MYYIQVIGLRMHIFAEIPVISIATGNLLLISIGDVRDANFFPIELEINRPFCLNHEKLRVIDRIFCVTSCSSRLCVSHYRTDGTIVSYTTPDSSACAVD